MVGGSSTSGSANALEAALGYRFDPGRGLLTEALAHASAGRRNRGRVFSNQRLEFLGDRVLGLVIADLLLGRFPGEDEGDLALRHTALVQGPTLARVALSIGIAEHIVMSKGEEDAGGRANPSLLADTCEAVIGALYLDAGLGVAASFIHRYWEPLVEENPTPPQDAKTALQEWAQARGMELPVYQEMAREGPQHAPEFLIQVSLEGMAPEMARGPNKRAAELVAAGILLARLKEDHGRGG